MEEKRIIKVKQITFEVNSAVSDDLNPEFSVRLLDGEPVVNGHQFLFHSLTKKEKENIKELSTDLFKKNLCD